MSSLNFEGMAIADGVVETIVAIALEGVEGATLNNGQGAGGLLGQLGGKAVQGIEVTDNADGTLSATVHIDAAFGCALPELAANVRSAVADAVLSQVGVEVSSVDVYIDNIQFA